MQNELDIVRDVSARLEKAGIDYMLTGFMAMNYYAQPRMTRDIDLVVALRPADARTIVRLFASDYYVSAEAVESSIAHESLFNPRDVRNLAATGFDAAYVAHWTTELELRSLWEECAHE